MGIKLTQSRRDAEFYRKHFLCGSAALREIKRGNLPDAAYQEAGNRGEELDAFFGACLFGLT